MVKQNLRKQLNTKPGHNSPIPTLLMLIPAAVCPKAARVLGNQWLKGFHLKGQNNLAEGTKKNESAVLGQGRKPG